MPNQSTMPGAALRHATRKPRQAAQPAQGDASEVRGHAFASRADAFAARVEAILPQADASAARGVFLSAQSGPAAAQGFSILLLDAVAAGRFRKTLPRRCGKAVF